MTTNRLQQLVDEHDHLIIIQAENPDADSLGSALALESILIELKKKVSLHCPVTIPKYLRYLPGWDRVTEDFAHQATAAIIVDTASDILLSKTLANPVANNWLQKHPSITIDHHADTKPTLPFDSHLIIDQDVATAAIIYRLATQVSWPIASDTAQMLLAGIMSDTLGLTTPNVDAESYRLVAKLIDLGASPSQLEEDRQALNKKAPEILSYKAELIKRIEYHLDGRLATILIPFEDIQAYSNQYNPSMLVLDEMRSVEGVEVAIAIKTYPDGKLTGKLRTNQPVAEIIAGYFGGGGHQYAAGFRVYETYDQILPELITAVEKALE